MTKRKPPAGRPATVEEKAEPASEVLAVAGTAVQALNHPDPDPGPDGADDGDGAGPDPQVDETARADALAKLAGAPDPDPDPEPEPEPAPVEHTGRFLDLSDSDDGALYIVTRSKVAYRVHGNYRVARLGDQIRLSDVQAERGLRIGAIARYDI